jgi:hypothetical protein
VGCGAVEVPMDVAGAGPCPGHTPSYAATAPPVGAWRSNEALRRSLRHRASVASSLLEGLRGPALHSTPSPPRWTGAPAPHVWPELRSRGPGRSQVDPLGLGGTDVLPGSGLRALLRGPGPRGGPPARRVGGRGLPDVAPVVLYPDPIGPHPAGPPARRPRDVDGGQVRPCRARCGAGDEGTAGG